MNHYISDATFKKKYCLLEIDEESLLQVPADWLQKNGLKVGDSVEIESVIAENQDYAYRRGMDLLLNSLSKSAKTVAQLEKKLQENGFAYYSKMILNRVQELGLADDLTYAKNYVQSKTAVSFTGINKLSSVLTQKGISREIIEQALADYIETQEYEHTQHCIESLNRKNAHFPPSVRRTRVLQSAVSRGFSYSMCAELLDALLAEDAERSYQAYFEKKATNKIRNLLKKGLEPQEILYRVSRELIPQGADRELIARLVAEQLEGKGI